ncbi:hypothetical protein M2T92_02400 [Elizabethkingia miricola]|uniref:hypothetical protein n=1 Tax=Elizabethkingia miricola TaxID=172045 RepID=UPI0020134812|nr:hypothetical protein [Elizabethkingia miricola]MCL1677860.1 hypothetical protein [Elizabethkingia miricola]
MNRIFTVFTVLFTLSFMIFSCSGRDDDKGNPSGYIQISTNERLNIDNVNVHEMLNYNSTNKNVYIFSFTNIGKVNSNGITATKRVQMGVEFPNNEILDGDFNYQNSTRKMEYASTWYMDFDGASGKSEQISSEGKCSIKRIGRDRFTVTFSFKTGPDRIISGEYSGRVIIHDEKM